MLCKNLHCNDSNHKTELDNFYYSICGSLDIASKHLCNKSKKSLNKPGWSDYVADMYKYSREMRQLWLDNGKQRQGIIFNEFTRSKARFKYALRVIRKNETSLRKKSLAKKMTNLSSKDFWKEIGSINNSKTPLPCTIENANGPQEIIELWEKHYHGIFNCLNKITYESNSQLNDSIESVRVKNIEILDAMKSLKDNKSCGLDGIHAEHLKYASGK